MITLGHRTWKREYHFRVENRSVTIKIMWFWITLLNRVARGRKAFYPLKRKVNEIISIL